MTRFVTVHRAAAKFTPDENVNPARENNGRVRFRAGQVEAKEMVEYYVVIACARCDGGYQVAEKYSDESELNIEKTYGGGIVGRFDSEEDAQQFADEENAKDW